MSDENNQKREYGLEDIVKDSSEEFPDQHSEEVLKRKVVLVDTGGNITYSLIVGSVLDYCSGLDPLGILFSRLSASGFNSITGGPYGWWREKVYHITKTTKNHSKLRKTIAELVSFNTFQVPAYALSVAIGSYFSDGDIDFEKVSAGAKYLAMISPLVGPTMGLYMDYFRRCFGVKNASEGAYGNDDLRSYK